MKRHTFRGPALALALFIAAGVTPSHAHHSYGMFDQSQKVSLKGTVLKVEWANPHVYFLVEVTGPKTASSLYTVEAGSVNKMVRRGWKANTVRVGELVSFTIYPLRNGDSGGMLVSITGEDGVAHE